MNVISVEEDIHSLEFLKKNVNLKNNIINFFFVAGRNPQIL